MSSEVKVKVLLGLLVFVATGTAGALIASMAHMLEAFGYANQPLMSWALAVVTVVLNGVFVALWTMSEDKKVRRAIFAGMVLLLLVEFFGNFGAGGILAMRQIPAEMSELFLGLDRIVIVWAGTFLFAAFLPVLNFISIYALSEAALKLLTRQSATPEPNPWASLVLKLRENQPKAPEPQKVPEE